MPSIPQSRLASRNGTAVDVKNPLMLASCDIVRKQYLEALAASGEDVVEASSASPVTVTGVAAGNLANRFAYPAIRLTVQPTSAGAPGKTRLTIAYNTQLGATSDIWSAVPENRAIAEYFLLPGRAESSGRWTYSPVRLNTVVTIPGPITVRAADELTTAFTGGTSFNVAATVVTLNNGLLDDAFRALFGNIN